MLPAVAAIGLTLLLLLVVLVTWAADLRRAGVATSARERQGPEAAERTREARVRRMEARIRAERLRREATQPPRHATPDRDAPARPPEPDEARHRATLELEPGPVSAAALRRQYRALVVAYHPDRVAGLGRKLQVLADEETKSINEAYAYFKRRVGP